MLEIAEREALKRVIEDLSDSEFSARVARDSNTSPDRTEALERAVCQAGELLDLARERLANLGDEHE